MKVKVKRPIQHRHGWSLWWALNEATYQSLLREAKRQARWEHEKNKERDETLKTHQQVELFSRRQQDSWSCQTCGTSIEVCRECRHCRKCQKKYRPPCRFRRH